MTGYHDGRVALLLPRDDAGDLVAGIDGFTWGGYARVDVLWVEESCEAGSGAACSKPPNRKQARRGCRSIVLDSHEFQAPDLYRKLGYVEMGATIDTPIGGRHFFFQKGVAEQCLHARDRS